MAKMENVTKAAVAVVVVGLASACAQSVVAWVPLVGAAGLVFKTTQARKTAAPKPASAAETTVERTPLADFEALQARGTVLVVDVRNEDSFKAGHIPGAINVPIDEVERRTTEIISRAGSLAIVTYCSCVNEHTSAIAAEMFNKAGACRATALAGGYPAWVAGGRKVEHGIESYQLD